MGGNMERSRTLGLGSGWWHGLVMAELGEAAKTDELEDLIGQGWSLKRESLLTSKQVAPLVGVRHHKTVERYVREKGLPCVYIGRNLRFRHGDVHRWVAQRKEG